VAQALSCGIVPSITNRRKVSHATSTTSSAINIPVITRYLLFEPCLRRLNPRLSVAVHRQVGPESLRVQARNYRMSQAWLRGEGSRTESRRGTIVSVNCCLRSNRQLTSNVGNKIRTRLEKLEALVETSKAEKQAQSPNVPSSSTSDVQQGAQVPSPIEIHADEDMPPGGPRELLQQSCICPFRDSSLAGIPGLSGTDFQVDCRCGSTVEGAQLYVDSTNPIASFVDMENAESLYLNLPSPESLQCNTPTISFQDEFMGRDSLSGNSTSEQGPNSVGSSVLMDLPSTPPLQQTYPHIQHPFTVPMGYQMVPMGYMPSPGKLSGETVPLTTDH
jgi:hypothetical protein